MTVSFDPQGPVYGAPILLAPSASRATSGSGAGKPSQAYGTARLTLDVTAASGTTPTLDVAIETSPDGSTWTEVGTFSQQTDTATERKVFGGLDRYVRAAWVLGGTTPDFTFKVSGLLV